MKPNSNVAFDAIADMQLGILQVAEHFHVLPDQVEQMDEYWFNRTILYLRARAEAQPKLDG
jgi:hypothetical protein